MIVASSGSDSPKLQDPTSGRVSCVVALFLLSQVFLILSHSPLVQSLAWIILKTDSGVLEKGMDCSTMCLKFNSLFRVFQIQCISIAISESS